MKQITKRSVAMLLALCMLFASITAAALSPTGSSEVIREVVFPRGNPTVDQTFGVSGYRWGLPRELTIKSGWEIKHVVNENYDNFYKTSLACLNDYKTPAYCIEPGVNIQFNAYSEYWNTDDVWQRMTTYNSELSGSEIRAYIQSIIKYGYNKTDKSLTQWVTQETDGYNRISQQEATQLLIWETIVGERDSNFNWINPGPDYDRIFDRVSTKHPCYSGIKRYYDDIVNKVKNGYGVPSFCKNSSAAATAEENVKKLEYSNGAYRADFVDTNGVLSDFYIQCPAGVNAHIEGGNTLVVQSTSTIEEPVVIRLYKNVSTKKVRVWSDGKYRGASDNKQDVISPVNQDETITVEGYIGVFCPHVHHWIPHKVMPTCTTVGYTVWKCDCGIMTTTDPYTFTDSHVAATGHDPNSPWIVSVPETCTEAGERVQICDRCNAALKASTIQPHNHDAGVWRIDVEPTASRAGSKSLYCTLCGEVLDTKTVEYHTHVFGHSEIVSQPACTESGLNGSFCSVCNACYKTTVLEKTGHTSAAQSVWTVTTAPTCLKDGEETGYCGRCGVKNGTRKVEKLGHGTGNWITNVYPTCNESGESVCVCDRCGEIINRKIIPASGHTEGDWVITQKASCKKDGEKALICERCGATLDTDKIPATDHDDGVWSIETYPTCTSSGEKILTCTTCGKELDSIKLPAKGHGTANWITNVKATCTTAGEEIYVCSDCGGILDTRPVNPLGHDSGVTTESRPNGCTSAGEKITTCTRCGGIIKSEVIPAENHDGGVWKLDFRATADHNGQKARYCTKCGEVLETAEFPMHTHEYGYSRTIVEPTCKSKGEAALFCKICSEQYSSEELDMLEHDYSKIYTNNNGTHSRKCSVCQYVDTVSCSFETKSSKATCTAPGETVRTCSVCNYSYQVSSDKALGHDWTKWVNDKNNTTHTRTCNRCSVKETEPHYWTEWRLIEKNFDNWTATYQRKCELCGALQSSTVEMSSKPHAHTLEHFPAVEPLCLEDGNSEYYHCTDPDCDKYFSDSEGRIEIEEGSWFLPAHGHNYVLKERVKPECEKDGYEYYECTYDSSHKDTKELIGHPHNYILKERVDATCEEDGYEYYECTYDSSHKYTNELTAHGHDYVEVKRVEPTCEEDGYVYYECSYDASHNYTKKLPAHGHDYNLIPEKCVDATPEAAGYNYYECSYDSSHHYYRNVYSADDVKPGKRAKFDKDTGIATITLEASTEASTQRITVSEAQPVDVVLVLDTSGSMAHDLEGRENNLQGPARMDVLKNAAKKFISDIAANEADNRIAIVTFASNAAFYNASGKATSYMKSTGWYGSRPISNNDPAYASALIPAKDGEKTLTGIVGQLTSYGSTRADYGMKVAENIIDNRADSSRKVLIVFITDGVPTDERDFDHPIANSAIDSAHNLKSGHGSTVYTVDLGVDEYSNKDKASMTAFMNATSSDYPEATSLAVLGAKTDSDIIYHVDARDSESLKLVFDAVFKDSVLPSTPFSDLTLYDTVSKEFTMTTEQEERFREAVTAKYGENCEILVVRNDDGTTSISVKHIEPEAVRDGNGQVVKYTVSISFDVSANGLAKGMSYYNTNTQDAWLIVGGMYVSRFDSPRVSVPDDRNIVVFVLEDEVYSIAVADVGEKVKAPTVANAVWDMSEDFTVTEAYTEINGTLTTSERTLTWVLANDRVVEEHYKVGQRINVCADTGAEGWEFLGWDSEVPFRMPDENLTITAMYQQHTHETKQVSQYGSCTEGITYVYACKCGYSYTIKSAAEPHKFKAEITNCNNLSLASLECEVCGYTDEKYITYQAEYNDETINTNFHGNTGTNQIFDLTMYDGEVTVQPDGTIDIVLPATPQMILDENLRIYRINQDGYREDVSFVKNPDTESITITVDHFSCYVITASNRYEKNKTYEQAVCPFEKGHNYEVAAIQPATCSADGISAHVCTNCGESYGEGVIPAGGHLDNDHDGYCDDCHQMTEARANCKHICHSDKWYAKILWAIMKFFMQMFHIKPYCECGTKHY